MTLSPNPSDNLTEQATELMSELFRRAGQLEPNSDLNRKISLTMTLLDTLVVLTVNLLFPGHEQETFNLMKKHFDEFAQTKNPTPTHEEPTHVQ